MAIGFEKLYHAYTQSKWVQKLYRKSSAAQFIWHKLEPIVLTAEYKTQTLNRLNIERFLPTEKYGGGGINNGKIKIRFLLGSMASWNAIEPIITTFQEDEKYDVLVLICGKYPQEERILQCDAHDFPCAVVGENEQFSLQDDKPDIFVFFDVFDISALGGEKIRAASKMIVAPLVQLISYVRNQGSFLTSDDQRELEQCRPDYILADSLLYRFLTENSRKRIGSVDIMEMGNVKYDRIYDAVTNGREVSAWKKLKGKKTILYCPDHNISHYSPHDNVSFDVFGADIFQWMWRHPDIGMIFRPHPSLEGELRRENIWSPEDFSRLKRAIRESANIVWDEHESYDEAYANCDAILTDAGCGIILSALPTGKPLGALYRNDEVKPYHPELNSALYEIRNHEQLDAFLEMARNGEDPMKETRTSAAKEFILHFDGKNAYRIKQFIDENWRELQGKDLP